MKEEVRRIIAMVQEGKISAEDAAELIDAFGGEGQETAPPAHEPHGSSAPPPPPPSSEPGAHKDVFKQFVEAMEGLGKDASESVNWKEIAGQVKTGVKKGADAIRSGIEELSKGKYDFFFLGAQETKEVELPLSAGAGKQLRIEHLDGDIRISGGKPESKVHAKARFRAATIEDARAKAQGYDLVIEESETAITIKQPPISGMSVDLDISLSEIGALEVTATSGDVEIEHIQGSVRVTSRSGDLKLASVKGMIETTTTSGEVHLDDCEGPTISVQDTSGDVRVRRAKASLNIRAASGDVELDGCEGRSIAAETVSGTIQIDLLSPLEGTLNVRTVSGDASINLVDGSDCRVHLSTINGEVHCDLPLLDEARSGEGRITGRLGSGAGSLDASAVSGDVTVRLRNAAVV